MGRSAVKCHYSHELTAAVTILHAIKPTRSVNIPQTALSGPECITNNTEGQEGGREICLVLAGGNTENRVGYGYDEDMLFT